MDYYLSVACSMCIYAILALSLSLMVGHTGIFSLAQAGVMGVGAYTFSLLTVDAGLPELPAAVLAIVVASLLGAIMAVPSLWIVGEYFVVASLSMQYLIEQVLLNARGITHGFEGVTGIERPEPFGFDINNDAHFLVFAAAVTLVAIVAVVWAVRSPWGDILHAIRDDELVATTLGKKVKLTKMSVSAFSGALAGTAGVLYAMFVYYISPSNFLIHLSITAVMMMVIGGRSSVTGAVLGAGIVTALPQVLPSLGLTSVISGPQQQVVFGLALIIIVMTRPEGLVASDSWLGTLSGRLRPRPRKRATP